MNKSSRFELVHNEGSIFKDKGVVQILKDKETGVLYILCKVSYGVAMTPLLGADGKPVIE